MTEIKIPLDASLVQSLLSSETEGVQRLLKQVLEAILEARATDIAGAGRYERSEDRKYQRNGYIEKWITFRIGRLKIRIPQLRGDSLIDRGLKGIKFITSDQHQGLVNAADECFPESSWNRCQTHFTRNLLSHVPEQYHDDVLEDLHSIYNCKSHRRAMKKANEVILKYGSSSEESLRRERTRSMKQRIIILAVYILPEKYHRKLRTGNMVERLNREIRRREKVIGIFPGDSSVMRLIGAYLMEIDEDWTTGRVYMDMKKYDLWVKEQEEKKKTEQIKAVSKKTVEVA